MRVGGDMGGRRIRALCCSAHQTPLLHALGLSLTVRLYIGDVRSELRRIASNSVHCAVTSPPYFGLRDYGCAGQIGLEPTPDDYVAEMVAVFREVQRVLRPDGTLWLNLGDSYAGGGCGARDPERWPKQSRSAGTTMPIHSKKQTGLKNKDRLMIPARVALALQADGWYLRDEIIWHKPNPMPVSVTDRTTPAHEMLYMLSKSARYYYDMEQIREPLSESTLKRWKGVPTRTGPNGTDTVARSTPTGKETTCGANPAGRQPRSVWSIPTRPFKGAHFATFPPDLIRPCILAGCPKGGTVLDPFFGAGTTGVVANELGRNAVGVELNQEYAAIALERILAAQGANRRLQVAA